MLNMTPTMTEYYNLAFIETDGAYDNSQEEVASGKFKALHDDLATEAYLVLALAAVKGDLMAIHELKRISEILEAKEDERNDEPESYPNDMIRYGLIEHDFTGDLPARI
jgi:hypothetical protein